MTFELKEALIGAASTLAAGVSGWVAFGRYWIASRARNANDIQQIDMLERQEQYISRLEQTNQQLREEITVKDGTIREYWRTITDTQARLQIIENSQKFLERQNEALKKQVTELTIANNEMARELKKLRSHFEAVTEGNVK